MTNRLSYVSMWIMAHIAPLNQLSFWLRNLNEVWPKSRPIEVDRIAQFKQRFQIHLQNSKSHVLS